MKRCVVHDEDEFWLRLATAVVEKLFNKILRCTRVCRPLEDSRHQHAIIAICWENLIPLTVLETGNLGATRTS